jgi:hypothetical protein
MPSSLYLFPHIAVLLFSQVAKWAVQFFFQSAKTFAPDKNQIAPDYYN